MNQNMTTATQDLHHAHCTPCEIGTPPFTTEQEDEWRSQVPDWELSRTDIHQLRRTFSFANFAQALEFVNAVGKIAQFEQHHPDVCLHDFRKVTITLYTHKIGGLSANDFIVAAKIDQMRV